MVGVLGLLAAVSVPMLIGTSRPAQAEAAAKRIAAALRFTRDEALRTGTPYGITLTPGTPSDTLSVFVLDTGTTPPTPRHTVRHPLSRQLYRENLGSGSPFPDARLATPPVTTTAGQTDTLCFGSDGAPLIIQGNALLRLTGSSAQIRVTAPPHSHDVQVAVETGRVTVN